MFGTPLARSGATLRGKSQAFAADNRFEGGPRTVLPSWTVLVFALNVSGYFSRDAPWCADQSAATIRLARLAAVGADALGVVPAADRTAAKAHSACALISDIAGVAGSANPIRPRTPAIGRAEPPTAAWAIVAKRAVKWAGTAVRHAAAAALARSDAHVSATNEPVRTAAVVDARAPPAKAARTGCDVVTSNKCCCTQRQQAAKRRSPRTGPGGTSPLIEARWVHDTSDRSGPTLLRWSPAASRLGSVRKHQVGPRGTDRLGLARPGVSLAEASTAYGTQPRCQPRGRGGAMRVRQRARLVDLCRCRGGIRGREAARGAFFVRILRGCGQPLDF